MNENKGKKLSNLIGGIEKEVESICLKFNDFSDGVRLLLLLERTKDSGHNKEDKRVVMTKVTLDRDSFKKGLTELLILKETLYKSHRIYLSVNPRNIAQIIRDIEIDLLNAHYTDSLCRESTYTKLIKSPRHWVMQPKNSIGSLFILDIDDKGGIDKSGEALKKVEELGVEVRLAYRTKNGWHIVVEPFNPSLWDSTLGEIKKDGLLLLSY